MDRKFRRVLLLATVIAIAAAGAAPRSTQSQPAPTAAPKESLVFVTDDSGNAARFRVREQLVGFDLPNDAIGTTPAVSGELVLRANGSVSPLSKFTVDIRRLKSDEDKRDRYVQTRILDSAKYPTVAFLITHINGLKLPLATSGSVHFTMRGNLTVHGSTKPTNWKVTANLSPAEVTGTASTVFTFEDFGLLRPKVPIVLSVQDTIRLEYDFRLVRKQ
jgi:polyisoprenoid-binding protein YceI